MCPYGLYSEQLSGTAFTVPRGKNQKSWLYRIRPSVAHRAFREMEQADASFDLLKVNPNQLRWKPFTIPTNPDLTFVSGLKLMAGAGDPTMKHGIAVYVYTATASMNKCAMYDSDGDLLIVPQQGSLNIQTEMGLMRVDQCEIAVIPRGIKFSVKVEGPSRGYVLEVGNMLGVSE